LITLSSRTASVAGLLTAWQPIGLVLKRCWLLADWPSCRGVPLAADLAGDLAGAAAAADAARRADLADRYTNSMAVKALFAAGQIEAAEQTASLFTRDGDQVR
jgi:hypothetical protein